MEKLRYLQKNKIAGLPKAPGVYFFKKGAKFLYIGKAANLQDRVRQHQGLLDEAKQVGYIRTDSEIEALLLEARLIKKYQPKYNVVWKDDKNYFFVSITKEDFPRIFITHQPSNNRNQTAIIGPFVDGQALKQTLKVLRRVFPYRSCRNLPKKPCLWYQLDRCPAPCLLGSEIKSLRLIQKCQRNAKILIKILQGKKSQVVKYLKKEMKALSKEERFEEAGKIKKQIWALDKVLSHAIVIRQPWSSCSRKRIEAYDISNIQGKEATGSMVVFTEGKADKTQYRKFKIKMSGKPNDTAMLKEVLERRFRHKEWPYPDLILVDGGKAQLRAASASIHSLTPRPRVMALAKKENKLYIEGRKEPVLLKNLPRGFSNLIMQLRDEAHRFALSYHHSLRRLALLKK
jgi:excinuclease ABC subunit C